MDIPIYPYLKWVMKTQLYLLKKYEQKNNDRFLFFNFHILLSMFDKKDLPAYVYQISQMIYINFFCDLKVS